MTEPRTRDEVIQQDIDDLHGLGYAQELFRSMGGFSNFANISAPMQFITVHGPLSLTGGGSTPGTRGAGARIGGLGGDSPTPTQLTLNVDVPLLDVGRLAVIRIHHAGTVLVAPGNIVGRRNKAIRGQPAIKLRSGRIVQHIDDVRAAYR